MPGGNYAALRSAEKFEAFVDRMIAAGKPFGFDIETGYDGPAGEGIALQVFHPRWKLVGFSFTNSTEWARYVPVSHDNGDNVDDPVRTAKALWRLLQTGLGVAHNLSFEMKGLAKWFRQLLWDDPEVGPAVQASKGQYPGRSDSLVECFLTARYHPLTVGQDLKSLTLHVFNHKMIKFEELFPDLKGAKLKQARFNSLELTSQVVTYACEDSVWCLALHLHPDHYATLMKECPLVLKTEIALVPVLAEMEREAIALDWDLIDRKADEVYEFGQLMNEEIQQDFSERLGEVVSVNLSSPKQLGEVLFERLGVPVSARSDKTGAASTSEKALRTVAKADPIVRRVLEYREVVKLYGSYLDKYRKQLNYADDHRAHPSHKQTGALTGRMSVDGFSYQQLPKPYHYELRSGRSFDFNFRNVILAPPGTRIVGFDYSQVELRVLAGQANETSLLQAFADNIDIHKATASNMMGIPLEAVDKKTRAKGKTLNFAVVYGSGPDNIATMLTTPEDPVTKEDAEELLSRYFAAFPKLRGWMDQKVVEGRQQGYVVNLFGRKFTVWEYLDPKPYIRSKGDRMCVNAPIQGGAADYAKIAMVRADKALRKAGLIDKVRMVMMVHDALEFYVADDVPTQTVLDVLGPAVSFPITGLPEIRADWHEGRRLGEVIEIKRDDQGQICGYGIEDVEEGFDNIVDAYSYIDEHRGEKKQKPVKPDNAVVATSTPMDSVVTLSSMPDANQWDLFKMFLKKHVGDTKVTVITPEGPVELPGFALTQADQPQVSALLGGAYLTLQAQDNDYYADDFDDLMEDA